MPVLEKYIWYGWTFYFLDLPYPDFCITPNSPDLDCADIPRRRFRVLQPDPHGFDRDQDGIGCE